MKRSMSRGGYTLVEVMVSVVILVLALGGAIAGWLFVLRGERLQSSQQGLDIDVRKALERIKAGLRLSSMDKIHFYPEGPGPYSAISFPLARDDDGDGLVELDMSGKVIWDKTVVYHVWQSTPHQLRMTTFDPRDNTLTPAERQQQLAAVVTAGNGAGTYNGQNATTIPVFENLFTWNIVGKGAVFDAYRTSLGREVGANLGSIMLTPGSHDFKFTVVGKNPASAGYKIGLDTVVVSPSGLDREAEYQTVVAQAGASASAVYVPAGSWSGNYHLFFPATGPEQYFTLSMENDRWEERNFRTAGTVCSNTFVQFDTTLTPKSFTVSMQPADNTWYASDQALDVFGGATSNEALRGCAVRVLVRGKTLMEGSAIKFNGPFHCLWLFAPPASRLNIVAAYIAEAADHLNYTPNIVGTTSKQLFFNGNPTVNIASNSYAQGQLASGQTLYIDKEKSYIVSLLINYGASGNTDAKCWKEFHTGTGGNPPPPGSYVLPATAAPTTADLYAENWSARPALEVHDKIYALERLHLLAPSNATFTSQIVDTQLAAPAYQQLSWNAIRPWGTGIRMKVRTGNSADLSDAAEWSAITGLTAPGTISPGNRRYVQFRSEMTASSDGWYVPAIRDVIIRWTGETRVTDIGATMTVGPDYGIHQLMVDGKPLVKGVTIDLTIFKNMINVGGGSSNRLTSTATVEVEPRNTGK